MGSRTLTQGKSGNDLPIDKEGKNENVAGVVGVYWNDGRQERRPQDLSVTRVKNHKKREKPQEKETNDTKEEKKEGKIKREERQERENWKKK